MKTRAEIRFYLKSFDNGVGFTIMKAAYLYGITGRMDYNSNTGAFIQAEGDFDSISEFIDWIAEISENKIIFNKLLEYSGKYNEFDIYRKPG